MNGSTCTGSCDPKQGKVDFLLFPLVDIEVFSLALQHFAQAVGAGQHRRIVLVLDQAGWHESNGVVIPEGIHLLFLPPYSPELQPCERLRPLSNEAIANRRFESLDELQEAQAARCVARKSDLLCSRVSTHSSIGGLPHAQKSRTV